MLTEGMYGMYIVIVAFAFLGFSKLECVPVTKSVKRIQIAVTILTINFFVAWFALLQSTRQLVVFTYPAAFKLVFYTTFISAPGVLLYTYARYALFQ